MICADTTARAEGAATDATLASPAPWLLCQGQWGVLEQFLDLAGAERLQVEVGYLVGTPEGARSPRTVLVPRAAYRLPASGGLWTTTTQALHLRHGAPGHPDNLWQIHPSREAALAAL